MDTVIDLLLSAPDWAVTYLLPALVVGVIMLLGWCALSATKDEPYIHDAHEEVPSVGSPDERGRNLTRREGLDEVLAGRWEWDDYLEYFRGRPDDGSLTLKQRHEAEAKIAEECFRAAADRYIGWDLAKPGTESTVLRRCSKSAHPGIRVLKTRIDAENVPYWVWQPNAGCWVRLKKEDEVEFHYCCKDYAWIVTPEHRRT